MQRPNRLLENGILEAISNEEYIEFIAHQYEIDLKGNSVETTTDFYTFIIHEILKFHAGDMNYENFLEKMNESFLIHNEAFKRAKKSSKDTIKFN